MIKLFKLFNWKRHFISLFENTLFNETIYKVFNKKKNEHILRIYMYYL